MEITRTVTTNTYIDEDKVIYLLHRTGGGKFVNGGEWEDFHVCAKTTYSDELISLTRKEFNKFIKTIGDKLIINPEKTGNIHHFAKKFINSFDDMHLWFGQSNLMISIEKSVYKKLKKQLPELERKE